MADTEKPSTIRNTLKLAAISLALLGGTAAVAPAASAAPAAQDTVLRAEQLAPAPAAFRCRTTLHRNGLIRTCTVTSGYIRSYLRCSNNRTYYTRWLGRGSYRITQVCPSPYVRTASGIQTRG